jgi:ubiquinone/menaquinone biosynthesis C-methylase UbiE
MSHIFDVNHRNKLDSEERRRMLSPLETLRRLGYKAGTVFADIGCGTGLFTFPAAEIGGRTAKVYAVDISPEMLSDVRQRVGELGYANIEAVQSDAYDFKLAGSSADFILICTVLHEIDDKARFLIEAKRISAPGAKIAVIEFNEKELGFGPPISHRLPQTYTGELLMAAGFSDIQSVDIGEVFYAVTGIG